MPPYGVNIYGDSGPRVTAKRLAKLFKSIFNVQSVVKPTHIPDALEKDM